MKLKWRGNQKCSEDISKATILQLDNKLEMSIHKHLGCGDNIFLTCHPLRIRAVSLDTKDWEVAKETAIRRVQEEAKKIYDLAMKLSEPN